jgi:tetratricopeptide (TPR) repeat protein
MIGNIVRFFERILFKPARYFAVNYTNKLPVFNKYTAKTFVGLLGREKKYDKVLSYIERVPEKHRQQHAVVNRELDALYVFKRFEEFLRQAEKNLPLVSDTNKLRQAELMLGAGNPDRAAEMLDAFLKRSPLNVKAVSLRVQAAIKSNAEAELVEKLDRALATTKATNTGALLLKAELCRLLERYDEAGQTFHEAHLSAPRDEAIARHYMRSVLSLPSDTQIDNALDCGADLLKRKFIDDAAVLMARLYLRSTSPEKIQDGLAELESSFDVKKHRSPTIALVETYYKLNNYRKCRQLLQTYLGSHPNDRDVVYRLAAVMVQQALPGEAIDLLLKHFNGAQRDAHFLARVGHILAWSGAVDEAMPWLHKAIAKDRNLAVAVSDLSLCYELKREVTTTLLLMKQAVSLMTYGFNSPRISGLDEMAPARLKRRMMFAAHIVGEDDLARALLLEAQYREPIALPFPVNEWTQGSLAGKSVVALTESGIGDEIRYTCIYHRLLGEAETVTVTCDPRIANLVRRSFPAFTVFPVQREFPRIKVKRQEARNLAMSTKMRNIASDEVIRHGETADIWLRTVNLFERDSFKRAHSHQSPEHPVLIPDPAQQKSYAARLCEVAGKRPVVGLSWRGGERSYSRDPHYFDIPQWEALLAQEDYCFVNLQYATKDEELDYLRSSLGERFIEFPDLDLRDDIEGLAALCSQLDQVVSICTMVLELSAAVHTPTLYLMRSPQVTHAIRLNGDQDEFGSYQDDVWAQCRIIPRYQISDDAIVAKAISYLAKHLQAPSA